MDAFNLNQNEQFENATIQICRFFRESVAKVMGKTAIWTILRFCPLPILNNVEE